MENYISLEQYESGSDRDKDSQSAETVNTVYIVRTDIILDEMMTEHTVYGIDAVEHGKVIMSIPDITFDRAEAERLSELCNRMKLDVMHLKDVAEDAVVSECII